MPSEPVQRDGAWWMQRDDGIWVRWHDSAWWMQRDDGVWMRWQDGAWWVQQGNGAWIRWSDVGSATADSNATMRGQGPPGAASVRQGRPPTSPPPPAAAHHDRVAASTGPVRPAPPPRQDQPGQQKPRMSGPLLAVVGVLVLGVVAFSVYALAFSGKDDAAGSGTRGTSAAATPTRTAAKPAAVGQATPKPAAAGQAAPAKPAAPGQAASKPAAPGQAAPGQAALGALACEHTGSGKAYEVGPGQALDSLGKVPWESLVAGDTVRIHWRAEPYREKFFLRGKGAKDQPIVVCGVAGPAGELPVIDGQNAVTRAGLPTPFSGKGEPRGLIHITVGAADPWGYKPEYLVIQGLHIRNAFHEYSFTGADGKVTPYAENAAGIFVERGEHIIVRGVEIEGNGNGFFVASGDSEEVLSRDILLERSRVYGNGTVKVANDRHHNIYTEAVGTVFQFNDIGPLRQGSLGAALKDRSAGTVVRYNRIEGGSRTLDLVDAQDSAVLTKDLPEYRTTLVYGNILLNGQVGPSNMVHYGGDSGLPELYRKGTLYFYNNTVVVQVDKEGPNGRWRTSLFDADTAEETIDARNNVIVVQPATAGGNATELTWMRYEGTLKLGANWASPEMFEWREDKPPAKGGISGLDKVIGKGSNDPVFTNAAAGDFTLAPGAAAAGTSEPLHDVPVSLNATVDFEYVHPASGRPRPAGVGMGAFASTGAAAAAPPAAPPAAPAAAAKPAAPAAATKPAAPAAATKPAVPAAAAKPAAPPASAAGAPPGAPGKAGPTSSGSAKADGWVGPLQFLGKGPDGYDNGQRLACTGARSGSPSVICVRAGAGSGGNGTAAAPFATIGAALAAAAPQDVIQVAAGVYPENVAIGTQISEQVQTSIMLLGGFSPDFATRDASQFRSVIDGKGAGPAVQFHLQSDDKTVLDGFRITGGKGLGTDPDTGNGCGGGIFAEIIGNGEILISHNEIFGNQTAGLEDDNRGGGIHTDAQDYDGSNPVIRIEDNVIHSNQAGRAAGINVTGRQATILRNVVEANRAHSDHGGGIYVSTVKSTEVADNVVRGNEIGATVNYGWGGGIYVGAAPAELHGNIIAGNFAPTIGSGVFWDEGAKGTMREDLLFGNGCSTDERSGTALYLDGGAGPSIVTIEHVTIAGHNCPFAAPSGAAILVEASSKLTVKDSIIWDNTRDFQTLDNGSFTAENSITSASGNGNRAADPLFVDPANGDFHLKPGSSAIGLASDKTNAGAYPK
ncbi:MAG: hypothetical protein AB7K36_00460 [Chloroflexota bacterium]